LRLRFYFYAKRLFFKNQMLALWQSRIRSKLSLFGILVYVALLLFGSFVITDILTIDNLQKNIPVLLVSAGAMLGGILAIIFSFGTLLMQNAAGSSSAGFYNVVGRDPVQHLIYWILTFIIIYCFGLAIPLGQSEILSKYVFLFSSAVSLAFFLIVK